MATYVRQEMLRRQPRLPLNGSIDLTYRCNNRCRHCWSWSPPAAPAQARELTFDEIRTIVDSARRMGCRTWSISGGEPMLRPDFASIFDYITGSCASYTLNSNGTLITPAIAQLMKRKGNKMIALYGATAEVYDHITRHPGGFAAAMRGMRYLQEAGAGFIVQIIPMRENYQQMDAMKRLAESLSPHQRIGAAWLYLSSDGAADLNREIVRQRLDPGAVVSLDSPDPSWQKQTGVAGEYAHPGDDRLFARCATAKDQFHIDAYGKMTFCSFIKDPAMRYDVRQGSFQDAWEHFIPSLADYVHTNQEYKDNCGSCELRHTCRWCPAYAYLEHGRFTAKVDYLCAIAREAQTYTQSWLQTHRRYYQCAGMTIQFDSELPLSQITLDPKFTPFAVSGSGEDNIVISHFYGLPNMPSDLGEELYRKPPWAIYRKGNSWIYTSISANSADTQLYQVAVFNHDYTRARIYNRDATVLEKNTIQSLTFFPTDQILLAQLLADRQGCYLHASGVIMDGRGLLFVGHSEAGKSTTVKMLREHAQILCDDRIIARRWPSGFRIHGTWSHGEIADVSPNSAPLKAIFFLTKDTDNRLTLLTDKREIVRKLLACLIKPFETAIWWQKTLSVIEQIANETPCYDMHFDKSGHIVAILRDTVST